jgi:hypothetical protein
MEGLFDGGSFIHGAHLPIVPRFTRSGLYAIKLLAVGDPKTLRDEAVFARDPLLNLLIGGSVMLGVGHLWAVAEGLS